MARGNKYPNVKVVPLPLAPWLYINDPTGGDATAKLACLIPNSACIDVPPTPYNSSVLVATLKDKAGRDTVKILADNRTDHEHSAKLAAVEVFKTAAIKHGCNFVSVNIHRGQASPSPTEFGTNHLELSVDDQQAAVDGEEVAAKIYKWLFSVLEVRETLHLIPERQMREIDSTTGHQDYTYSTIADARLQPRDAKVQFVALIVTKPIVGANQRLTWQVADKTGIANFFFTWRGPSSQYTWDWVLALKPGDRHSLPRMPSVLVRESTATTVIKSPFRATGSVVVGTGRLVQGLGSGLTKLGRKIKLGRSSEWLAQVDTVVDKDGRTIKRPAATGGVTVTRPADKTEFVVFTEKGAKTWSDVDSLASTTAGSISEKDPKQFV